LQFKSSPQDHTITDLTPFQTELTIPSSKTLIRVNIGHLFSQLWYWSKI